ncbi:MAG TPA: hypothetical protein VK654_12805 [Nitrospirota bacterium]|nr:hypothetical protein [Nitrospirota bacterium]
MCKTFRMLAILGWGVLSLCMTPSLSPGQEGHEHGRPQKERSAADQRHDHRASPLVHEMIILDGVFRDVVSAVALGDGARARKALEAMHGTMEETHEGVDEGTVKLRKNAGRLHEFIELDKAFHARLEALALAAGKNDQKSMLTLTKELLDRCAGCHQVFR